MTSILGAINQSNNTTGIRVVFSAMEKVGKTTVACSAPGPLLVPCEVGYGGVTVPKVPMLQTWEQVVQFMAEVLAACQARQFPFKTIIFDSVTAIERFIHQNVLEADPSWGKGNKKALTMEAAHGGYGKAYLRANEIFEDFLKQCDILAVYYGINIVMTCHVFSSEVKDPNAGTYSSWDLLLHSPKNQKNYGKREILTQWADIIGYIYEPITVVEGAKMNKAVSNNVGRVLAVNRTPSYVAGNRFNVVKDIPLPQVNGWNSLAHAIYEAKGIDVFNRDVK